MNLDKTNDQLPKGSEGNTMGVWEAPVLTTNYWTYSGCLLCPNLFVVLMGRIPRHSQDEEGVWVGDLRSESGLFVGDMVLLTSWF